MSLTQFNFHPNPSHPWQYFITKLFGYKTYQTLLQYLAWISSNFMSSMITLINLVIRSSHVSMMYSVGHTWLHSYKHWYHACNNQLHVILRCLVVITQMCDKKEIKCRMWHYRTTQSQRCSNDNNYNDDIVMHPSLWFELFFSFFSVFFLCFSNHAMYAKGNMTIRSEI